MSVDAQALARGANYHRAGAYVQAEEAYREALRANPQSAEALYYLGAVQLAQNKLDEAVAAFRQSMQLRPASAELLNNLGVALAKQRHFDEAADSLRKGLRLRPDSIDLHITLGNILKEQGNLDAAIECYREVTRLAPENAEGHNILGSAYAVQGLLDAANAHFWEALRLVPRFHVPHSNYLLGLNYQPSADAKVVLAEHRFWDRLHGQGLALKARHANEGDPDRRLRIGYVSPDLRAHAVAHFVLPILLSHDRARFEVYGYAEVPAPDAVTARCQSLVAGWRCTCGISDTQLAEQVRADGIDILIDLAGHSANNRLRLFTLKPAPLQATYLGYPNTTGLATMDALLTDGVADRAGDESNYTEELIRLPALCCYSPPEEAPDVASPPSERNGYITYGSTHNLAKLRPEAIALWCEVLRVVPNARLLLFRNTLSGRSQETLRARFANLGVAERVTFQHRTDNLAGYLQVYSGIDILLDAFPWSGHATTCEALWMGVPVVTLYGDRHAGRLSASVLTTCGLEDWIARSPAEYVAKARRFATEKKGLAQWRRPLRELVSASPLCDGPRFTRHLEAALRSLWQRWCSSPS